MSNYRIRIESDTNCLDPRKDFDNMGIMVCWHSSYNLGDEQPKEDAETYREELPEDSIALPLFLYDHSGLTMNTSGFSCGWDSSCVGFIYVTPETIIKEFGDDFEESREKARLNLVSEVNIYDLSLRGQVWGYTVEKLPACDSCGHVEPENIDSCWGFFGEDYKDVIEEMKGHIDDQYHHLLDQAWENRH